MKAVITARSAMFSGSPDVERYWERILVAKPAELSSFEKIWNLKREAYFSRGPSAQNKIYLDQAYSLPTAFPESIAPLHLADEGRQLSIGRTILDKLLEDLRAQGKILNPERTAFVLGTSWSDGHYIAADSRMVAFGQSPAEAMGDRRMDPAGQLEQLAAHIGCKGPRFAVDTACASSLYAMACAERLIASDQADHVIVLGLNAHLPSFLFIGFSKIQALSRSGAMLPFSKDADGIILGEGVAAVLVENVDAALREGRKPLAVIRSLGLSADGREGSVFSPGREGQTLAYTRAYQSLALDEIDYVEAHGTGTAAGDAAEIDCLTAFFAAAGVRELPIGSVKSLIGHTLAASGMASLIKSLEMLRTHILPPHIQVTPHERLEGSCLRLLNEARTCELRGRPMRIGINSLGFGGANAHLVIEEWVEEKRPIMSLVKEKPRRFAIIAHDLLQGSTEIPFPERPEHRGRGYPLGRYLQGDVTLDRRLLNLGPAQIKRLDPFLALISHQVARVFGVTEASPDKTGIIVCSNFGSEASLKLTRKFQSLFHGKDEFKDLNMSMEAITSALPALTSGLPAAASNLRGLHMTLSGGRDNFWHALFSLPAWFDKGLDCILLSASSFLKSPYDLPKEGEAPPAEASASFAIVPEEEARGRALAWIEFCAKDQTADRKVDCLQSMPNLFEASGVETLAACLSGSARSEVLEICQGSMSLGKIRMTRTDRNLPSFAAIPSEFAVPISFGRSSQANPSQSTTHDLVVWNESLADLVQRFLLSRQRVCTALLGEGMSLRPLARSQISRRRDNVTIHSVQASSGKASAEIVLDETHPYFFDHPLDHIPGILILEGALQLVEAYLQENPTIVEGRFLAQASIAFKRYIEKDSKALLQLTAVGQKLRVDCIQGQSICCSIDVELRRPQSSVPGAADKSHYEAVENKAVLHKWKEENILVSRIREVEGSRGERYRSLALPLGPGHFFQDGDSLSVSLVYLLEVARQSMMQLAHSVLGIPFGLPMNLAHLKISLHAPVPRQGQLILEQTKSKVMEDDESLVARIRTAFIVDGADLGGTEITAQVVKKNYSAKREKKSTQGDGWLLLPERRNEASRILLLCHHAGGSALSYMPWVQALSEDWLPVFLEMPGRGLNKGEPVKDWETVVNEVVPHLEALCKGRPLSIFGHSMGGLVAYMLASALQNKASVKLSNVVISGIGPDAYQRFAQPEVAEDFYRRMEGPDLVPAAIQENPEAMAHYRRTLRDDGDLIKAFRPSDILHVPVGLCTGDGDSHVPPEAMEAWKSYVAMPQFRTFAGDHFYWRHAIEALVSFLQMLDERERKHA